MRSNLVNTQDRSISPFWFTYKYRLARFNSAIVRIFGNMGTFKIEIRRSIFMAIELLEFQLKSVSLSSLYSVSTAILNLRFSRSSLFTHWWVGRQTSISKLRFKAWKLLSDKHYCCHFQSGRSRIYLHLTSLTFLRSAQINVAIAIHLK